MALRPQRRARAPSPRSSPLQDPQCWWCLHAFTRAEIQPAAARLSWLRTQMFTNAVGNDLGHAPGVVIDAAPPRSASPLCTEDPRLPPVPPFLRVGRGRLSPPDYASHATLRIIFSIKALFHSRPRPVGALLAGARYTPPSGL